MREYSECQKNLMRCIKANMHNTLQLVEVYAKNGDYGQAVFALASHSGMREILDMVERENCERE